MNSYSRSLSHSLSAGLHILALLDFSDRRLAGQIKSISSVLRELRQRWSQLGPTTRQPLAGKETTADQRMSSANYLEFYITN